MCVQVTCPQCVSASILYVLGQLPADLCNLDLHKVAQIMDGLSLVCFHKLSWEASRSEAFSPEQDRRPDYLCCFPPAFHLRLLSSVKKPVTHEAHNLEGVIERPPLDSSRSLSLTQSSCGSLFTAGPDAVVCGEKCPVLMLQDWLSGPNKSHLFCMLIYSLLPGMKKKTFPSGSL